MTRDFDKKLEAYARLLLEVGLDLKEGDGLILNFDIWSLELARKIVKLAYRAGAKDLILNFSDDEMELSRYVEAGDEVFKNYPKFKVDFTEEAFKDNYHSLYLGGPNPELLSQVDRKRVARWQRTASLARKQVQHYQMDNLVKWCLALVPSQAWAGLVFPELSEEEALKELWELVFRINRLDKQDPVKAWRDQDRSLKERQDFLNRSNFEKLLFQGPGTQLEVYLVENHRWIGGSSQLERGDCFMANIPTEEIFTMPDRSRVEGFVSSTKPLSLQGELVEDFSFTFKEGRVVDFSAARGQEVLEKLLEMDEGASYLGEVALVAQDSPISKTGLLFYNTLYDENASCHLALGSAYGENLADGQSLSQEEKSARGMNDSIIHVDFMVGSDELDVYGVKKDGTRVALLEKGNWL